MITAEFHPTIFPVPPVVYTDHPYVMVEMKRKDPTHIYRRQCYQWEKSSSNMYEQTYNGARIIGLHQGRSLTSATLEKEITVTKAGKHWILLRVVRTPQSRDQTITLTIDGKLIKTINTYHQTVHYRFLDFGEVELSEGTHTFIVGLNGKRTWVDHLLMYRLDYFSSEETKSSHRLDWSNIEFTENAMGELNSAEITLPLKECWNDPNQNFYSRKHFEFTDIVNIIVGGSDDWTKARVKFGGYVLGYDEADDSSEITLACADRLLDFYRKPVYMNYWVGVKPASDEHFTFPIIQQPTFLEAIRHASETSEYGPMNYGISYPYSAKRNYRLFSDFESVTVSGFTKTYSPSLGLRLGYDKLTPDQCGVTPDLDCNALLFDSEYDPIDASIEDMFCLEYLAAGVACGENNRVQFNIEVTMYKEGQSPGDALTYTILWTGKAGASRVIGQATPVLEGTQEFLKFDWNKAFDKYASSSHYYVTRIELVDVATSDQIIRRENSTFNLLGWIVYDSDLNVKMKVNQETGYPYENIVEMLENAGYVAYVDYGRERRHDVLCIAPPMNEKALIEAVEGVNVLDVTDKSYEPRESIRNSILAHYHYKVGSNEKTGVSYYENQDSVARFGPGSWQQYEDKTDMSKKADADLYCKAYVEENSYPMQSFTLVMNGTSILHPAQYIVTDLKRHYIRGNFPTKTATHNISQDEGYKTSIGVNRPDSYYNVVMDKLEQNLKRYMGEHSDSMYNRQVLANMGFTSPGAFIKGGY